MRDAQDDYNHWWNQAQCIQNFLDFTHSDMQRLTEIAKKKGPDAEVAQKDSAYPFFHRSWYFVVSLLRAANASFKVRRIRRIVSKVRRDLESERDEEMDGFRNEYNDARRALTKQHHMQAALL